MGNRGPKPKYGNCSNCSQSCQLTREIYCRSCYTKLLKNGSLQKLPQKELPTELSTIQKDVLIGALLGDGCLFKYKPTHTPYFSVQRAIKDKLYANWQCDIFGDLICKTSEGSTYDKRTKKEYGWTRFRSHRCNIFEVFYNDWYPHGTKIVPRNIQLNPLSLAVWIADDGYVRSVGVSPWRLQLKLSTHGFDIESVERLCLLLHKRYNEYFGITLDKKKPIIYASDAGTRALLAEVDSCFPNCMSRKMHWRKPEVCFYENNYAKCINVKLRKTKNGKRCKKGKIP